MKYFEVLAAGYCGTDDSTDDRVLWVAAPTATYLAATLTGVPYERMMQLPEGVVDAPDFRLPLDDEALRARLQWFADNPPALPTDTEMLDWLCAHPGHRIRGSDAAGWVMWDVSTGLSLYSESATAREAIAVAMRKEKK